MRNEFDKTHKNFSLVHCIYFKKNINTEHCEDQDTLDRCPEVMV